MNLRFYFTVLRMCFTLEFVELVFVPKDHDHYLNILWDYYFREGRFLTALNTGKQVLTIRVNVLHPNPTPR